MPEKLYEESFAELLEQVIRKDGEISPFSDGRLTLNWDITEK